MLSTRRAPKHPLLSSSLISSFSFDCLPWIWHSHTISPTGIQTDMTKTIHILQSPRHFDNLHPIDQESSSPDAVMAAMAAGTKSVEEGTDQSPRSRRDDDLAHVSPASARKSSAETTGVQSTGRQSLLCQALEE